MPRLYFLSTGAGISNITNLKHLVSNSARMCSSLVLPKSGVKEQRNLGGAVRVWGEE
jgi:hypothetical protein